jgi:hypothetical protein
MILPSPERGIIAGGADKYVCLTIDSMEEGSFTTFRASVSEPDEGALLMTVVCHGPGGAGSQPAHAARPWPARPVGVKRSAPAAPAARPAPA